MLASCCSAARATSSGTTWMVLTAAEADLFGCGRSRQSWHGVWPKFCICGQRARETWRKRVADILATCESNAARCASSTASTSTAPWYVQK